MNTALNDIPRRVKVLEGEYKEQGERITGTEKVIGEIRTDLAWIKWILKVVAPTVIIHLLVSVVHIVIAFSTRIPSG